jgi:hypothetical protein
MALQDWWTQMTAVISHQPFGEEEPPLLATAEAPWAEEL